MFINLDDGYTDDDDDIPIELMGIEIEEGAMEDLERLLGNDLESDSNDDDSDDDDGVDGAGQEIGLGRPWRAANAADGVDDDDDDEETAEANEEEEDEDSGPIAVDPEFVRNARIALRRFRDARRADGGVVEEAATAEPNAAEHSVGDDDADVDVATTAGVVDEDNNEAGPSGPRKSANVSAAAKRKHSSDDSGDSSFDENAPDSDDSDDDDDDSMDEAEAMDDEDDVVKAIIANTKTERKHPPDLAFEDFIVDISFHPVEDLLAVGTMGGDIVITRYTNEENTTVSTLECHLKAIRDLEFSEDGLMLYSTAKDKSIILSDVQTAQMTRVYDDAHEVPVYRMAVIDENMFATGKSDDDATSCVCWMFCNSNLSLSMQATRMES